MTTIVRFNATTAHALMERGLLVRDDDAKEPASLEEIIPDDDGLFTLELSDEWLAGVRRHAAELGVPASTDWDAFFQGLVAAEANNLAREADNGRWRILP